MRRWRRYGGKEIEIRGTRMMHDEDSADERDAAAADVTPGEYDHLLRQIEKEEIPERLLDLALKLQAALVERRRLGAEDERRAGT